MPPSIDSLAGSRPSATAAEAKPKLAHYKRDEVAQHNKDGDRWIIIRDKVYDISKFINIHPGTDVPLRGLSGKDATSVFKQYHPVEIWESSPKPYLVGKVVKEEKRDTWQSELSRDFDRMVREVKKAGLNDITWSHRLWYVKWTIVYLGILYFACKLTMGKTWLEVTLGAVLMALYWQQIAFVGHDAGHNSITHNRNGDWCWGIFVTGTFGVSGRWWKRNHNTHHIFPNSVDWDPDIQHLPLFAIAKDFFKGVYSQYYEFKFTFGPVERFLVSMQHILWIPVMGVARYNMYAQSFLLVFKTSKFMERRIPEFFALVFYWCWYGWVLSQVATTGMLVWTVVLSHFLCGLLHFQIVLSHFPMETYMGNGYEGTNGDNWIVRQFQTTMDIDCPWYMDWFHGGLQYQCVHHLIPRLPRPVLRYVQKHYVQPFADRHKISYTRLNWFDGIAKMQERMRTQAKLASQIKFKESVLFSLFAAEG